MGGPIVRTGTTPEFWSNWDQAFGVKGKKKPAKAKKKAAKKTSSAKARKKSTKKAAEKSVKKAAVKKRAGKSKKSAARMK